MALMGEHDVIETQDGFVVCRCTRTFSDNTNEEAMARHRVHWREEMRKVDDVAAEGLAESRAALARALLKTEDGDVGEWT